jgi:predicted deacetylase
MRATGMLALLISFMAIGGKVMYLALAEETSTTPIARTFAPLRSLVRVSRAATRALLDVGLRISSLLEHRQLLHVETGVVDVCLSCGSNARRNCSRLPLASPEWASNCVVRSGIQMGTNGLSSGPRGSRQRLQRQLQHLYIRLRQLQHHHQPARTAQQSQQRQRQQRRQMTHWISKC